MTLKERIRCALEQLPGNANKIAAYLAERDCKGIPQAANDCPIAVYFRQNVPGLDGHNVSHFFVSWFEDTPPVYNSLTFPSHVRQFIDAFDDGCYRDLIA